MFNINRLPILKPAEFFGPSDSKTKEDSSNLAYLQDLYPEIFPYLRGGDLVICMRINRAWNYCLNHNVTNPWKTAFLTDFCLPQPKCSQEEHYKILYGKRIFSLKNIRANQPTKTMQINIETKGKPSISYLSINNRLVIAIDDQILIYSSLGQLERTLVSFPSNVSPTIVKQQNEGLIAANITEQPLIAPNRNVQIIYAEGDLFLADQGKLFAFGRLQQETAFLLSLI